MKKIIGIVLFLVPVLASAFHPIPGFVPLEYGSRPATDLVYNGKILLPEEANALVLQSKGKFDLSLLNPIEDSDIWKNTPPRPLDPSLDNLGFNASEETVKYLSNVLSRAGNFRFSATKTDLHGIPATYTFLLSKKLHNVLLRKNLLRKLGYEIPGIQWLPKLKIDFKNTIDKELFLKSLAESTYGDPERWVIKDDTLPETQLYLQDLVVMKADDLIYNLGIGAMSDDVVKGRRLFSSLLVPYSLVEVPESVNLFPWHAGQIISGNLKLDYPSADQFGTSYEDARWIARRISALSRDDWKDIVDQVSIPKEASLLLTEKLISRRNTLNAYLKIDSLDLSFDSKISSHPLLVGGKLTQELWDGYASRFAYGDPESPLSTTEVFAFFKSQAITIALQNLVSRFNGIPALNTDIDKAIYNHKYEKIYNEILHYLETGKPLKEHFQSYFIPTFGGALIASREVVAGSYLGTDNLIQLVDTIGAQMSAGVYIGFENLPIQLQKLSFEMGGGGKLSVTRTWSHLRPIVSIKKALRYPLKNIVVPIVQHKYGHFMDELMTVDFDSKTDEEKQKTLKEVVKDIKDQVAIGESIIITDTIGAGLSLTAGIPIYQILTGKVGVAADQTVISRMHIQRASENTIHLYRDIGEAQKTGFTFQLSAILNLFTMNSYFMPGQARVKFFSLNIDDDITKNKDLKTNLLAYRSAVMHHSTEIAQSLSKPYILNHKFRENGFSLAFLPFRFNRVQSATQMSLTHPEGEVKKLYRRYLAKSFGTDFQSFTSDIVEAVLTKASKKKVQFGGYDGTNPGYSFLGKARNKIITYEGEVSDTDDVAEPFVKLSYIWNGWAMNKGKAERLLNRLERRYHFPFFPETILNEAKRLLLYNISLNLFFYSTGIDHMMNSTDDEVRRIFVENGKNPTTEKDEDEYNDDLEEESADSQEEPLSGSGFQRFIHLRNRYHRAKLKGNLARASRIALRAVSVAEKSLEVEHLIELVGGKENIYIFSKMDGFRKGDEDANNAVTSHALGEFGSVNLAGPFAAIRSKIGMTESEFFINWIMRRLF